ncbi:MAG TPA: acyl-CoA dehydrogenase family protein [Myxococcota bacterium]|nr:acyl-CoA dehydrogenase family protein [Myxococcota bacterium]
MTSPSALSGALLIDRARELKPFVQGFADRAEAERTLPAEVVHALREAGLFRVAVAAEVGGAEATPREQILAIEAISEADGAAGWALMIGVENLGFASAFLQPDVAEEVIAKHPEAIFCGALNPQGRANRVDGGVRVSGRWPFASGCLHADWFWGQCILEEGGKPREMLEVLVPRSQFRVLDTWHVAGLRGSGSHDVEIEDVFVADRFTTRVGAGRMHVRGPLFRLPALSRLAYNKVGVATGIARAALDAFVELASQRVPRGMSAPLRERRFALESVAEAETLLGSARAFVFETVEELWQETLAGRTPTLRQRALVQIACVKAVMASARAVEIVHAAAGTHANALTSPLERRMRDVHVVGQHIVVSPALIEPASRVLLGLPPNGAIRPAARPA